MRVTAKFGKNFESSVQSTKSQNSAKMNQYCATGLYQRVSKSEKELWLLTPGVRQLTAV